MSRSKDQGTRYETARVRRWRAAGFPAGRLAEGGLDDLGDVWVGTHPEAPGNGGWIEECKWRANLNPHVTLAKAISKAGHLRVLLAHKRLVDKGGKRRVPDGMAEVVVVHPTVATLLVAAHEELARRDPMFIDDLWRSP